MRTLKTACILTAALAGTLASRWSFTDLDIIFVFLATVVVSGPLLAFLAGRRDVFDPIYFSSFVFLILFLARPFYDHLNGTLEWVYIDVSNEFFVSMLAVLCAVTFFNIGLMFPLGKRIAHNLPPPPKSLKKEVSLIYAFGLLSVAMVLKLLDAQLQGGLHTLLLRREFLEDGSVNIPFISEGFLIAIPAFLLFWYLKRELPLGASIGMVLSSGLILQSLITGNRRYALIFFAAMGVYYFVRKDKRPRVSALVGSAAIVLFGLLAPVELTRSGERTYPESVAIMFQQPLSGVEVLIMQSQSTGMVSAFGILVQDVGTDKPIPFRGGISTITETLLQPIPRAIWSNKPQPIRTLIIQEKWGFEDGGCVGLCPTFSALGTFYSDAGILGVSFGSLASGVITRVPHAYFQRHSRSVISQIMIAGVITVPLFLWWGALGSAVVIVGSVLIPVWGLWVLAGRHSGRSGSLFVSTPERERPNFSPPLDVNIKGLERNPHDPTRAKE